MIDCGEGAQATMRRLGLSFSRLSHVFISHMHGDHCLGLPGLLSTLSLHGKKSPLTVYLPAEGLEIMKSITDFFCREATYEINYVALEGAGGQILDLPSLTVEAFPLYHRVPAYGFVFREKPKPRHLRADMLDFFKVPVAMRPKLKEGADFVTEDGNVIANSRLTTSPDPSLSYAYCSDTMYDHRVAHAVKGVDVLYHEATYDDTLAETARQRGHSTARQAGMIAAEAGVKTLIIGHYSKRYYDTEILVLDAREAFPRVIASADGLQLDIALLCK